MNNKNSQITEIVAKSYRTTDGEIFQDKKLADKHQQHLDSPDCIVCEGKGKIYTDAGHDCWGKSEYWTSKCGVCLGTGKQDENYSARLDRYNSYLKMKSEFEC